LKILVTAGIVPEGIETLKQYADVQYQYYGEKLQMLAGKKLVDALAGFDIFITEIDALNAKVLAETPDLKCVASCRGNPVNIDLPACTEHGIPVIHTPGRNCDAVADLAVGLMIMLGRKIPQAMTLLHEEDKPGMMNMKMARMFTELKGIEMWEKTVGLVGLGAVGRQVAARLRPFNARVIAFDPYCKPEVAESLGVRLVSLDDLLAQSDFVSVHAAVTPETTGLLKAEQFAKMKQGAYFINTARAAITDELALAEALKSGHLAGAALDVFVKEPPASDHPLLQLPNVIALPHIGGNTEQIPIHQSRIVVDDIVRFIKGERPHNLANPSAWKA
jgi:autoinducer 2 (AI-2) kinase